jgi:hypothetical protein
MLTFHLWAGDEKVEAPEAGIEPAATRLKVVRSAD